MGEEKKEEAKTEEEPQEILIKVDMHCEACARKVERALKGFEGVEEVSADSKTSKVVVKGKAADPVKVCERLQKKSGRKVELLSPLPPPPEQIKPQEQEVKEEPKEDKKDEPPPVVTVTLSIRMHCEACAQDLRRQIRKIQGVDSVETDLANAQVTVKGVVDPMKLVEVVCRKTRKQASIVQDEDEKEEEKKEEEEKKDGDGEGEEKAGNDDAKEIISDMINKSEIWLSTYYSEFAYTPQIFSDENPNACSIM